MRRPHRSGLAVAAIAAVALLAAACGSSGSGGSSSSKLTASAPGITASTITIGSHQPLTGIAALVTVWAVRKADQRQKELAPVAEEEQTAAA